MVNKPELLFSGAAFLVCANNDFSSFQAYFSDSSRLWSWFHETVNGVLEGLQDEKHHHHTLQCIEPLQTGFAYSNAFTRFWKNNCAGRPCTELGIAFARNQHALKMGKVAMFGLWRSGSDAERLLRLGDALGDLKLSSPVHHSLHSGRAMLSNYYPFQKQSSGIY